MTKGVYKLVFPFFTLVVLCYFWNELYQRPLPSLAKDWMPKPIEEPEVGFFKYIKVLGSGDRYYLLNLNTDRGLVQNVRTYLEPGSYWKNVTISSEGKIINKELTKSRDTGCIENAVIMRRSGIVRVAGIQADDVYGNFHGRIDLVNCKPNKWLNSYSKVEEPTPYKAGDLVNYFGGKTPEVQTIAEVVGDKVRFKGFTRLTETQWVSPVKVETKAKLEAEPKAMTDIKWIPVDPENLPKGEVLAMRANLWLVGKLEKETNSSTVLVSFSTTDENTYFFNPVAYIPLDNLKQLWEEQNPANRYSSDSEAFKLLEWVIESDSSLGKALGEIPVEAEHTIEILAQQIINQSWLVEDAPRSPSRASYKFFSFREELIYWIKYLLD